MNPRMPLLVSSIVLFGAAYIFASSARADDLLDVYRLAQQNDAQLRAARAQLNAQLELKPQARARLYPTLNLNADYTQTRTEIDTGSTTTKDSYPSRSLYLTLTQPLYHADAFAQQDQADAQVSAAHANFKAQEQNLGLRAAERYFEVLASQDNLAFVKTEHEAIGKQLEQTKQRFNVGLIAVTDVHEAQARFDLSSAQVILAENRLANAGESLREITAQNVRSLAGLPAETPLPTPTPADAEQWVQMALKQNPTLVSAQYSVDEAQETVRLQRGLGYPTVDLVGTFGESDSSDSDISGAERTSTSVALGLNWVVYKGGAIESATRRAAAQLELAKENMEQARRSVTRQTRETYLSIVATISRASALKQAVLSQKSALAATEAGYEIGTRTTVDVLNARTLLFASQRDFTQARYDYVLATLQLQSAVGALGAENLQQANSWLKK